MAQPNEELRRLVKERDWLKFSLTRFKSFYDEEGQTIDVDSLEERLNCTVEFIERFEALQERIEILVKKYINFRQNFEKTYRSNRCVVICVWSTSFTPLSMTTSHRLLLISLPTFSGELSEWVFF